MIGSFRFRKRSPDPNAIDTEPRAQEPALPIIQSDAIVIGQVTSAQAHLI